MQLTPRQEAILRAVVSQYGETGRPVGSKTLVQIGVVDASSSTIRYELGRLENLGLLEHPHTSAGRIPTDTGYRLYVDELMAGGEEDRDRSLFATTSERSEEFDVALIRTTEALARLTDLLAIATTPHAHGASIRHIEVLHVMPTMIVVVCITENGDVSKHVARLNQPADPGLVRWAGEYLNEQITGKVLGQSLLTHRLFRDDLSERERSILELMAPVFEELVTDDNETVIAGDPVHLSSYGEEMKHLIACLALPGERKRIIAAMRRGQPLRGVSIRIGNENTASEMEYLSCISCSYGLPTRPLGLIALIGPRAINYPHATQAVDTAASMLDTLSQEIYQ